MNAILVLLFVFVALGLAETRLGKHVYILAGLVAAAYVLYAYSSL